MRNRFLCLFFPFIAVLTGCATTIPVSSLSKVETDDYVVVKKFRYGESKGNASSIGLEEGTYKVEYANEEGFFYRGPGLSVKIPGALNMNQVEYPDDLFQGGIFIPKDASSKEYRIYYYQDNLPGSPGPVAAESQRQIDRERNFRPATPLRGRGQLVLVPPTSDIDMQQYVSRPAR